ncbi:MAG: SGNH/GDSL hydrolase family protein, partial [Marmoricola sp.]
MRRYLVAGLLLAQVAAGAAVTTVASADPAASVPAPTATAVARRVLITGDSITQGSAGDYTWRYRLWQKLQRTAPATTFVGVREDVYDLVHGRAGSHAYATGFPGDAHAAVWGDTYSREVDRIAGEVAQTRPDVLVVMLGGNDLTYQATPAQTVARAAAYIARARTARPGLDVVVGQATDRYDLWRHQPLIQGPAREYARGLDALAAQLDTPSQRVVVARTLQGWDAAHDTWDGTHPNPTGESLIAQRVSEALARLGVGTMAPDVSGSRAWSVPGPLPGVSAGSGAAMLTWDRARTGASGMYVEERLLQTHEAWHRLPYAMPGNGGTVGLLVPGGLYQLRLVPVKGSSTGA